MIRKCGNVHNSFPPIGQYGTGLHESPTDVVTQKHKSRVHRFVTKLEVTASIFDRL